MKSKKGTDNEQKMDSKNFVQFWNYVEKRAFMPADNKEIESWFWCFMKFFNKIFEGRDVFSEVKKKSDFYPEFNKEGNQFIYEFIFTPLDITCECRIKKRISGFTFLISWQGIDLQFEYDKKNFCEFDYLNEHCELSNKFDEDQLKTVLENKICHPAIHFHIKGKTTGHTKEESDFPHDIRIGPATKNPFFFLYQLHYQFLYIYGDKKERELNRLNTVIFNNKEEIDISPGVLFGVKK